jgi:methyl-branched lipid omega-hydroxylase
MTTIETTLPNPIKPEFWVRPQPEIEADLAIVRSAPLAHHEEEEIPAEFDFPQGPGAWVVTKLDQILEVSKNPQLYSSAAGITILDAPPEFNEFFTSMISMDDPRHGRLRKLVSAGFTPKMLAKLEDGVARQARMIVDEVAERGECDFVVDIAARLPLKIVCDLMAIPDSQLDFVFAQSNFILGAGDPEYAPAEGADPLVALLTAGTELSELMNDVAKSKEGTDSEDLTTMLVNAEIDGERLTYEEIAGFFILLVVAGNETTRNAISWGLSYLTDNPDQRAIWADDFEGVGPRAVEEIVRLASPVTYMRRTAMADTRLAGQEISEGDKVVMMYLAANRDEDHFVDPYRFDVRRDPNPHVGFGGPGPHFCLGAHLARREILVMFRELFARLPDIQASAPPDVLLSSFIHGVKHLPAVFTPTGPSRN